MFHIGDISYARGSVSLWDQFFYQLSNMTAVMPWMVCDGNHERDWPDSGSLFNGTDSGGECGVAYSSRFNMPTNGEPGVTYWSIDYGSVHLTFMSTELAFGPSSPQYKWIVQDLLGVNRSQTPFIVFNGHRPAYIDSTFATGAGSDQVVATALRASLEPLWKAYQVDVAFWGHHHSAQRTCPVYNLECVDPSVGTIHIVTGASGAGFTNSLEDPTPPFWQFVEVNQHAYSRVRVRGDSMKIEFVSSNDRSVIDSVTIQSKFPAQQQQQAAHKPSQRSRANRQAGKDGAIAEF